MLHWQNLNVVGIHWPTRCGNVNLCGSRHYHVLLHLGVHQTKPTICMGLNHDLDFSLLFPGTSISVLWPTDGDGDHPAAAIQHPVKVTGSLCLLGCREGHPAKALARAAFACFPGQMHAFDLSHVLQRCLDSLFFDVRRQAAQKDGVWLDGIFFWLLHSGGISLCALSLTWRCHRYKGIRRCIGWTLLQHSFWHGGCRAQRKAVECRARLAFGGNPPQSNASTNVATIFRLKRRPLVVQICTPKDVISWFQRITKFGDGW
mmetsp:Transcript_87317/g.138537  ORF Transcript_87317/g.138537 Transcript_87317/m.138537 type:complete len:260 (+) Transcript_87317:671-1450(+)